MPKAGVDYVKGLVNLKGKLETERSSWIPHWRELSDFILPRRSRFILSDANRGERRSQKIIDDTATLASRTLRSGMMAGLTSPARPWFRLSIPNPDLAEFGPVKEWLHIITQRMQAVMLKGNLYNSLPTVYGDLGVFGTAAMLAEEDMEDVVRTYVFPVGSYMISQNERGVVDVFVREFRMTVRQVVSMFGYDGRVPNAGKPDWENISTSIRMAWEKGEMETWADVCHVIRPNLDYDPQRMQSKYKKYSSVYFEIGRSGAGQYSKAALEGKLLRESGYNLFPILCPRWETTAEDAYGSSSPGMVSLGDIKQMQTGEKRSAQAIEKMVNPPMVGPHALRSVRASILPGDITYLDEPQGSPGFRPAHEVRFSVTELENKQAQVRQRIKQAFYEDIFLSFTRTDRRQITAREVDARYEERLLELGPVLQRIEGDMLSPLIDIYFDIMVRQQLIPPPPPEIEGSAIKVEFISIMSQAQRASGLGGVERFTTFVGQVAGAVPETLDKVDTDQMVDEYGEMIGISPRIVRTDEQVAQIRAARAQAAQAQTSVENTAIAAKTARDLSQSKLTEKSALSEILALSEAGAIA